MMPWTVHRAIDHQTFRQRPAVMRASRADRKKLVAASGNKHWFAKRVSQKHFAVGNLFGFAAFFEIRSPELARCFSHKDSPCSCNIRIVPDRSNNRLVVTARF